DRQAVAGSGATGEPSPVAATRRHRSAQAGRGAPFLLRRAAICGLGSADCPPFAGDHSNRFGDLTDMARSAIINVMVQAAMKAGRSLSRDFGEVQNLQVSL